jgi:hypothetical protein
MAFSKTQLFTTVFGNKRVVGLSVVADANSGAVDSGLSVIDAVLTGVSSAATGAQKFKKNKNSAGTALNGSIFMSSCTSGDDFFVVVIGN